MFSKYATWILSPLGTALCLAAYAWFLAWRGHVRVGLGAALLAFVWLWLWSMPLVSFWLRSTIEDQYHSVTLSALPQAQAVVVLGGAVAPPSVRSNEINLGGAADRVWHAARLFHGGKAPLVVLSGGSDLQRSQYSEARAMAVFLQDLAVPPHAIALEEVSRNTRENAYFTAELLRARGIHHILLVTSALHMPRALELFVGQGLEVVPAPTDFEANLSPPGLLAWLPDALALDASGRAFKELVGTWVRP